MVTGIRLLKKDRIIHIFISERKLLPHGKVDETSYLNDTTWVSDYNFVIEDSGVENEIDYHTLTWTDRSIELDTIRGPKDELVTGARFRVINSRLRFQIRKNPFFFLLIKIFFLLKLQYFFQLLSILRRNNTIHSGNWLFNS